MNHPCPEAFRVQDFLDGELVPAEKVAFEAHLKTCADCAADLAIYRVVFDRLAAIPLLEPSPLLADRVLAEVMPASPGRWVRTFGWVYAGGIVASLSAIAAAVSLPAPRAWLGGIAAEATRSVVGSFLFVLKSFNTTMLRLADGVGSSHGIWGQFAPVIRALGASLSHPALIFTVWAAVLACVAVVWWMRPRERRGIEGSDHVGILGL